MKDTLKLISAILLIIFIGLLSLYISGKSMIILIFSLLFLFAFNLLLRKIPTFKPYFTSSFNIFTSKYRSTISYDIPPDLMFAKVVEEIEHSDFKIVEAREDTFQIFAISSISWKSWGENIYIDVKEENGVSTLNFCSTTFFQIYSWGRNKQNFTRLINRIEDALVI